MGNMTLSVSDDLLKEIKKYSYIKWSEVVRIGFEKRLEALERIDVYKDLKESRNNLKKGDYISHRKIKKDLGLNDL